MEALEELRAVAREAAEQSERGIVPPVDEPTTFAEALKAAGPGSVLLFERHEGKRLTEMEPPLSVFIGPEGGFSPAEVEAAERAGLAIAGLGPRILRSETVDVRGGGGHLVAHRRLRLGSAHGRSRPDLPGRLPVLAGSRRTRSLPTASLRTRRSSCSATSTRTRRRTSWPFRADT